MVGDLTAAEAAARGVPQAWLDELVAARRALQVRIAGEERYVAIEDAGRLRDALGTALPVGVPEVFTEPVADPLGDLVGRYARTHGPFQPAEVATRLGLGRRRRHRHAAAAHRHRTAGHRRVPARRQRSGVVRRRRAARRSAGAAWPSCARRWSRCRSAPWPGSRPSWQSVGGRLRGADGVLAVVEQLAGALVPASALESLVLPARVRDYSPAMLDELTSAGEVLWAGAGGLPGGDGWISLVPADLAPLLLPEPLEVPGEGGGPRARPAGRRAGAVLPRAVRPRSARPTTPRSPTWSGTSSGPGR